jgi:hypothetical protein
MAALEVLTLNEATPQIIVPQVGDTYLLPYDATLTHSGNPSFTVETTTAGNTANIGLKNPGRTWSVNVRGDLSDAFTIRDETAGSVNRLTIDSSGNVEIIAGTLTIPDLCTINQAADETLGTDAGIKINGFADQSGANLKIGISSNGRTNVRSSGTYELRIVNTLVMDSSTSSTNFRTAFRAYSNFQWGSGANFTSLYQSSSDKLFFAYGNTATTDPFMVADSNGNVIFGGTTPLAQVHIDQNDSAAALPVLYLDQADLSEEMIEFNTTIGVGNPIEAVGAKTLTTTHFVKCTIPGGLTVYYPVGTIA